MTRTISDLLAEVPEGKSRLFKAKQPFVDDDRFVEVTTNWYYDQNISWNNSPEFEKGLWTGSREGLRIGLDTIAEPAVTFDGKRSKTVDFYSLSGGAVFLISMELLVVIEQLDPGSVEVKPVVIKAKDGEVAFNFVMPNRLLEAVDPTRCDVEIEAYEKGDRWGVLVRFFTGAAFQTEITKGIHNFADIDAPNKWFWSRELLAAAKEAGIRGIRATVPATLPSRDVDQF